MALGNWLRPARGEAQPAPEEEFRIAGRSELPNLAGRRGFLADHVLIHTHVPKTAGATLSSGLSSIVGGVHTMDLRLRRAIAPDDLGAADLDDLSLIAGHFAYGMHERFTRKPLYFAAVREPAERAVSNYRFLSSHEEHPDHQLAAGRSFQEAWSEMGIERRHDEQSRMLMGDPALDDIDPDALLRHIGEAYFLIIPQPEMTRTLTLLRAAFGVAWANIPRTNVSRGHEVSLDPIMRDSIRRANPADVQLYNHVVETFDASLDRACDYIASHCLQPLEGAGTVQEQDP